MSQVSARYQITIDRSARRLLSVRPGMLAVQVPVDDHLEVYFIPAPHRRSLFGVLPPQEPVSYEDWEAIREGAGQAIVEDV